MKIQDLQFHELATILPPLDDEDLKELAEDIKKNGLGERISLLDGRILDGRNRYNACKMAGRKLAADDLSGDVAAGHRFDVAAEPDLPRWARSGLANTGHRDRVRCDLRRHELDHL